MSFLEYKTKKQLLAEGFTHYATLWGIPIYIGDIDSDAPITMTANFIPDWVLMLADWVVFTMHDLFNPHEDLPFMFKIKGDIKE
ncbi:hypothetical protein [Actinobacillus pleuropneumoniae]|uniref:hypothetical protein n=1 Tax=Actinobacillus pleuropneumoniae TaxID=715 RepID=UPI001F209E7B|nr:hypothetical protein [Actinobacillus pleuropneumoniae]UKH19899.1 hypothetical protein D1109_01470 [Actinobacillus pleuropneumoniae]UPA21714.1 hypothetical protein JS559_04450 [Actinobacillus pleuropneumoniae]